MISAKTIGSTIKAALDASMAKPTAAISGIIMLCSLIKRPGLSTIRSIINMVQYMKKNGIPTEEGPDGSPNMLIAFAAGIFEEVYRAMREDASQTLAIQPGSLNITGTGGNAGGPVQITGSNLSTGSGVVLTQ